MRLYIALVLSFFCSIHLHAQNFKGKITDTNGEPLYGSTVYIKGVNQGLVCNETGSYQTTIPNGEYEVEYKCLGFKPEVRKINISTDRVTTLDIVLYETPFNLKEITVSNQEDPAYPIMRKAIEKAPLYAASVKEYTAEAYIKVNAELLKVSSLIDRMAKREEGLNYQILKSCYLHKNPSTKYVLQHPTSTNKQ